MPEQQSVKMTLTSEVTDMEVEQEKKQEICVPEVKRKKAETSSEAEETDKEVGVKISNRKDDMQRVMDELVSVPKRVLSRQSSQDSTRSSSPSSGCSTHTLTRHAHHKKTYENRNPAKRRRVDVLASEHKTEGENKVDEGDKEIKDEKRQDQKQQEEKTEDKAPIQNRRSRSSSTSSDSDTDRKKEHRLTRSAKRRLQDHDGESNRHTKKPARDRNSVNASTGGESGSDASSARSSRKSTDTKTPAAPPAPPPEPEVLGKRCSALNAAAKLLAMKGSVDTPGHTPRRDSAARANAAKDKNEKAKSKGAISLPPTNSVAKNATNKNSEKETASKLSTPNQPSRTPTRSTRQCPGSLVPPLETEYKKPKAEESRKSSGGKEGDREARRSSRGNSACSSISSDDGEGSRSSSNSSQRTHSISSQNAERHGSRSRATSSGSERDRSSDRSKTRDKKDKRDRSESRRDGRRSNKLQNEVTSSSGAEGTPDRVLRSVAALAAAQARTPAASTRSSASQNRNKT